MARPKRCRKIAAHPGCGLFKPAGVPARTLSEVNLTVDEFEALRLADHLGQYQQEAAGQMGISRQTFGRIIDAARKKVATALVEGFAIRIEGGEVEMTEMRVFQCLDCGQVWEEPFGTGRPAACPACESQNIEPVREAAQETGQGRGQGRHGHRGRGVGKGRGAGGGRGAGQGRGAGGGRGAGKRGGGGRGREVGQETADAEPTAPEGEDGE